MIPYVIQIAGNPATKGRPRFSNGRVHADSKTREAEEAFKWHLKAAGARKFSGPVKVELHFHRADKRRVDLDNLIKLAWDSMNGICFEDDSQIVELHAVLERGHDEPGTWLKVSPA